MPNDKAEQAKQKIAFLLHLDVVHSIAREAAHVKQPTTYRIEDPHAAQGPNAKRIGPLPVGARVCESLFVDNGVQ